MRTILALLVSAPVVAFAQNGNIAAQAAALQAAQANASVTAARPGDATMNCEQLQAEFAALAQTPSFQNFAAQQPGLNAQATALAGQATTALAAQQALPVEEAVAAPTEGKKKGGFLKKMGGIGAGLGLGGAGGRGGSAAAASVASQAVGAALGGGGDLAGGIGAAVATQAVTGAVAGAAQGGVQQMAAGTALNALGGGLLGGRGGQAAVVAAAAAAGAGGGAGLGGATDLAALQAINGAQAAQFAGQQLGNIAAVTPELMRGMHLLELAHSHTCAWAQGQ